MAKTKTRAEREAELLAMQQTPDGRDQIVALYLKTARQFPPAGTLGSHMIDVILDSEFPPGPP